jgi:hypothetical protein
MQTQEALKLWDQHAQWEAVPANDTGKHLSLAYEKTKERYREIPKLCLLRSHLVGGFDSRSRWCSACTMRDTCSRK